MMKLKPGLGDFYAIRPGNRVRLFYSSEPTWGEDIGFVRPSKVSAVEAKTSATEPHLTQTDKK